MHHQTDMKQTSFVSFGHTSNAAGKSRFCLFKFRKIFDFRRFSNAQHHCSQHPLAASLTSPQRTATPNEKQSNVDIVPMVWTTVLVQLLSANMVEIRFIQQHFVAAHTPRESPCVRSIIRANSVVVYGKNRTRLD